MQISTRRLALAFAVAFVAATALLPDKRAVDGGSLSKKTIHTASALRAELTQQRFGRGVQAACSALFAWTGSNPK